MNITDYQKICSAFLTHVENIGGRVLVHCISGLCTYCIGLYCLFVEFCFLVLVLCNSSIGNSSVAVK